MNDKSVLLATTILVVGGGLTIADASASTHPYGVNSIVQSNKSEWQQQSKSAGSKVDVQHILVAQSCKTANCTACW